MAPLFPEHRLKSKGRSANLHQKVKGAAGPVKSRHCCSQPAATAVALVATRQAGAFLHVLGCTYNLCLHAELLQTTEASLMYPRQLDLGGPVVGPAAGKQDGQLLVRPGGPLPPNSAPSSVSKLRSDIQTAGRPGAIKPKQTPSVLGGHSQLRGHLIADPTLQPTSSTAPAQSSLARRHSPPPCATCSPIKSLRAPRGASGARCGVGVCRSVLCMQAVHAG